MPKVLRIINRLNLGGPTYNAAYLSKYLAPEFETLLVSGVIQDSEASSEFIIRDLGLDVHYIPEISRNINPLKDLVGLRKLIRIIRQFKPDIVHTHAAKAGTLGRIAAAVCKVPVVLHTFHGHVFHSYFSPAKTNVFIRIERSLARRATGIIAISEKQKHELTKIYRICSEEKVHVIPLGFDLSRFNTDMEAKRKHFREQYSLNESTVAIGIVGRLVPIKNHYLFLHSVAEVIKNSPFSVKAFIIGDGELRAELEKLRNSLLPENLHNSVIFTSWIKDIDVAYAGLDIVALSSLNEGTPVSLIEAQASGKPIVTTDVGGIEDIVMPDKTAFLAFPETKEFSTKLSQLVSNQLLRQEMGMAGREFISERFEFKRLVNDTRSLYNSLLSLS